MFDLKFSPRSGGIEVEALSLSGKRFIEMVAGSPAAVSFNIMPSSEKAFRARAAKGGLKIAGAKPKSESQADQEAFAYAQMQRLS